MPRQRHQYAVSVLAEISQEAIRKLIYRALKGTVSDGPNICVNSAPANIREENFLLKVENEKLKAQLAKLAVDKAAAKEARERKTYARLHKLYGTPTP